MFVNMWFGQFKFSKKIGKTREGIFFKVFTNNIMEQSNILHEDELEDTDKDAWYKILEIHI